MRVSLASSIFNRWNLKHLFIIDREWIQQLSKYIFLKHIMHVNTVCEMSIQFKQISNKVLLTVKSDISHLLFYQAIHLDRRQDEEVMNLSIC